MRVELDIKHCVVCGRPLSKQQIRDGTVPHYCEYYVRQLGIWGYRAVDNPPLSVMMLGDGDGW